MHQSNCTLVLSVYCWIQHCFQVASQVATETNNTISREVASTSSESDSQHPQTLYVAIQPGAESGQGDQPAVYLEVVEAGSGTEVTSSDGQVNLVQEEMVIDNGRQHTANYYCLSFPC